MADNKKQPKQQQPKRQKSQKKAEAEGKEAKPKSKRNPYLYAAVIVIIVAAAVIFFLKGPALNANVPFSTFKSNIQSSPRLAVIATYANFNQSARLEPCYSSLIQVLALTRKASTIDFYLVDSSNSTCTYSSTGLGGPISLTTSNSSYCINIARGEDGIFLNYSQVNSTTITASHMYIYGNAAYMASCPITVDLS